eukprot:jgi/Mesvir1/29456/Mv26070-RA.1
MLGLSRVIPVCQRDVGDVVPGPPGWCLGVVMTDSAVNSKQGPIQLMIIVDGVNALATNKHLQTPDQRRSVSRKLTEPGRSRLGRPEVHGETVKISKSARRQADSHNRTLLNARVRGQSGQLHTGRRVLAESLYDVLHRFGNSAIVPRTVGCHESVVYQLLR